MFGYFLRISSKRSSQNGIVWMMPLDLVAEVTCFFFVVLAKSKANLRMRSTPLRVKMACWMAISSSVPWNMRPPIELYSPSVFSRTTQKSISPGLRLASGRRHALEQTHRTQVHVLVEVATDRDQQAPQRNVIGHARPADGAEKDALERLELLHAVVRHHLAGLHQAIARPVEIGELELEVEAPRGGLQHVHAFRQNFLANSVTRNERDLVLGHC